MLEKTADDADDADVLADPRHSRTQAADAAHDEIDVHAGLRRGVELLDDLGIDASVHLGDDARRPALSSVIRFASEPRRESCAHVARRGEQIPEAASAGGSWHGIED